MSDAADQLPPGRLVLFDDPRSTGLRPFTWVRTAGDLLLGMKTAEDRWRERAERDGVHFRRVTRGLLTSLARDRSAWRAASSADFGSDTQWVSDRLLPSVNAVAALAGMEVDSALLVAGQPIAFRGGPRSQAACSHGLDPVTGQDEEPSARILAAVADSAAHRRELPAADDFVAGLSNLVRLQPIWLDLDLEDALAKRPAPSATGDGVSYRLDRIRIARSAKIDHGALLDARDGAIVLDDGVEVGPHTWLKGPLYVGPGTRLLGGRLGGGSSFGPQCRLRGEVEATVALGYVNKAHDGFIGHSYLAEWVNLGALTTNSDLKNNYSNVSLQTPAGVIETGERKIGSFLGDHVKTRIGCLLDTGTIVGIGANLVGEPAMPSKWVPDFAWGTKGEDEYGLEKFLATAEIVMSRRGVTLDDAARRILRHSHAASRVHGRQEPSDA